MAPYSSRARTAGHIGGTSLKANAGHVPRRACRARGKVRDGAGGLIDESRATSVVELV